MRPENLCIREGVAGSLGAEGQRLPGMELGSWARCPRAPWDVLVSAAEGRSLRQRPRRPGPSRAIHRSERAGLREPCPSAEEAATLGPEVPSTELQVQKQTEWLRAAHGPHREVVAST